MNHPPRLVIAELTAADLPRAGGIVERRGGMLIHGAIIARECGLPGATELIYTGNLVTVDGYLGIVTVAAGGTA